MQAKKESKIKRGQGCKASASTDWLSEKSRQLIDYWQIRALTAEGKFEKLQVAILEYCNLYEIHPYQVGWDDVWPLAEIRVNKKRNAWILNGS